MIRYAVSRSTYVRYKRTATTIDYTDILPVCFSNYHKVMQWIEHNAYATESTRDAPRILDAEFKWKPNTLAKLSECETDEKYVFSRELEDSEYGNDVHIIVIYKIYRLEDVL